MYSERRRVEKLAEEVERARVQRQRNAPRDSLNEENFLCVICHLQQREVITLPCGHICMCFDCSRQCLSTSNRLCPICRLAVDSSHLIYLS